MEIKHFYDSDCITKDIFEWIEAKFLSYSSHMREMEQIKKWTFKEKS